MGYAYDDKHVLTFGKHAGSRLGDVPAGYLLWLLENSSMRENVGIFGYILKNKESLEAAAEEEKKEYYKNKKKRDE